MWSPLAFGLEKRLGAVGIVAGTLIATLANLLASRIIAGAFRGPDGAISGQARPRPPGRRGQNHGTPRGKPQGAALGE